MAIEAAEGGDIDAATLQLELALFRGRPIDDFAVVDAGREIGRIYRTNSPAEDWFWGAKLDVVGEAMRGHVASLEGAKAAFKAAYGEWSARAIKARG